ncbi:hypothetical protein [Nocardia aurea]|uniref:Uncharacterized protein n=1 Tax=Nocardia aurea TaxID=2144174 RepID=A0ABV3G4T2_9NOCA
MSTTSWCARGGCPAGRFDRVTRREELVERLPDVRFAIVLFTRRG